MSHQLSLNKKEYTFTQKLLHGLVFWPLSYTVDTLQYYFGCGEDVAKRNFTSNGFAPVDEESTCRKLTVTTGKVPADLVGEFVRNGPNPKFIPKGGHHWFDGDGMLHGVRIFPNGEISYINRYVQTEAHLAEAELGMPLHTRIGEMRGKLGLVKFILQKLRRAVGLQPIGSTANTSVLYHAQKFMALVEADVPYEVRITLDGIFETLARQSYGGKLAKMTAHPKIDPVTNELFFFAYSVVDKPYLNYGMIDPNGDLVRQFEVKIPKPIMMHDFAITKNYAIFLDFGLVFERESMIKGNPFVHDPNKESRIGVLNRYATSEESIKWFKVKPCFAYHTANAWESGDEIVLYGCNSLIESTDKRYPYTPYTAL